MSKKSKDNPADKLSLPEPPKDAFWQVRDVYGPVMYLCRKRKFLKWQFGAKEYAYYGGFRGTHCSPRWPNSDNTTLEEELVLCAEEILTTMNVYKKKNQEIADLYNTTVYLDDLIDSNGAALNNPITSELDRVLT